jgi:thiamine biosynthesis lipoprotein
MKHWRRGLVRVVVVGLLCVFAWWFGRPVSGGDGYFTGEAFATPYHVTYADGPDAGIVQQAVDAELARIDAMASTWREDSELMRYNRADDPESFVLSPQLKWLIERAKAIEAQTGGAFSLRPGGGAIDLSGIAKGYAVDRVVELLQREYGIKDCLVDIGGEVRAVGDRPGHDGWRVGIYLPTDRTDIEAPVLQLSDNSVATSGTYFKGDHILDPATGKPIENELLSASVIHPSNTTADALATAMVVMGPGRGLAWAADNGVHVIFLLKDGTRLEHRPE